MECNAVQNLSDSQVWNYLDGTLDPATALALDLHTDGCNFCKQLLDDKIEALMTGTGPSAQTDDIPRDPEQGLPRNG